MSRLISTRTAQQAIARLPRILADQNAAAARRAIQSIRANDNELVRQPRLRRPADDLDAAFREWLIDIGDSGYVVLYRVDDETAVILAIRRQREAGY